MTFEAGPWHCFGNELLDRLHQLIQQPSNTLKTLCSRQSQGALTLIPCNNLVYVIFYTSIFLAGGSNSSSQTIEYDPKKISFIPDYSAVIRDDCTYLEISAQTYLLAYKSTLISRNK